MLDNFFEVSSMLWEKRQQVLEQAPKEIRLLQLMKEFTPPQQHPMIENMIEAMVAINTLKAMNNISEDLWGIPDTSSIHSDGIYDLDEICMKKSQDSPALGLMLMMLAQGMMNN